MISGANLFRNLTVGTRFILKMDAEHDMMLCREDMDETEHIHAAMFVAQSKDHEQYRILNANGFIRYGINPILEGLVSMKLRFIEAKDETGTVIPEAVEEEEAGELDRLGATNIVHELIYEVVSCK